MILLIALLVHVIMEGRVLSAIIHSNAIAYLGLMVPHARITLMDALQVHALTELLVLLVTTHSNVIV
jgi:hypothetical protein